jgi:hypothetical protein
MSDTDSPADLADLAAKADTLREGVRGAATWKELIAVEKEIRGVREELELRARAERLLNELDDITAVIATVRSQGGWFDAGLHAKDRSAAG